MTTPFQPLPCDASGGGADAIDVENTLLCDVLPDGTVAGSALAVYEYDATGNPVGAPTFVDPVTGAPYVPQGVLQPCGDTCMPPVQFCFRSTATVAEPGRMYDLDLMLAQGFGVEELVIDLTAYPLNIVWEVTDPDGSEFAAQLQAAIQSQFPGETVTVTPPPISGTCGSPEAFHVHIECALLSEEPPTLVQLHYDAGRDLIQNPAYLEDPDISLDPCPADGWSSPGGGIRLLHRQDNPNPSTFGNPGPGTIRCTSVANRGWETNDPNASGGDFEIWCQALSGPAGLNVTPTPRGTPVQEINATNPAGGTTVWQTFQASASGPFTIRIVLGGRGGTDPIDIKLSTGDTDDTGVGDLINTTVNAAAVTGQANPWTVFEQVVNLVGGQTYTLSFKGPDAGGPGGVGGLFTDMRAFQTLPGTLATFATDDDTCTEDVTSTSTTCEYWQPLCAAGTIASWRRVSDGQVLANGAFWAQVPGPVCCLPDDSEGGGGSVGNLVNSYAVCAVVAGVRQTLQRVTITDQSGGIIQQQFIGPDGAPLTPTSWAPGYCGIESDIVCITIGGVQQSGRRQSIGGVQSFTGLNGTAVVPDSWSYGACSPEADQTLGNVCYATIPPTGQQHGFMTLDENDDPVLYDLTGTVVPAGTYTIIFCAEITQQSHILCDEGNDDHQFLRWYVDSPVLGQSDLQWDFELDGNTPYVPVGPVGTCSAACTPCQTLTLCDYGADVPVLITGISTGGTLSNGVTWSGARGSASNFNPQHSNVDGSWWGMPGFPNATVAPVTWFFDRPVDVEFSVVIAHSFGTGSGAVNSVQVPIGSELISSAPDYAYDVATGIVTVDSSNTGDCTKVTAPSVANSARFVLRRVTQFTLDFLGQRIAICGQFSNWRFGSIAVTPSTTTFLRTICRDCDGAVTTVTDTEPDGTTAYAPIGPVGDCGTPADAEPQCFATQICVQPQGVQEFISNEANLTSTVAVPNIDPVWQWSNDPVAGPWFNMYDVGVFPGWTTTDPGTTQGVANWVAPHPNSSPNTSGLPGEGPTIGPGNSQWYARAQFTLPPDADPASIRIAATVLNADQLGVEFRLNSGAWQPVNASHTAPPFSFPAQVIPGAQAGLNQVIVHVSETVFGSGAAGVKMHLIASYNRGDQQSWTQIVCTDGSVSYFTAAGEQADALPDDWAIVPCGAASGGTTTTECCPTILSEGCTNTGSGRYVAIRLEDGTISLVDAVTGAAIVAANVVSCPGDAIFTVSAEGRLLTAAQVWTPGADVVGTLTGVTLTVLTGSASYLDASGTAVGPLPAGFTASWNLSDDGNVLTPPQSITAAAASTVHVGWTRR